MSFGVMLLWVMLLWVEGPRLPIPGEQPPADTSCYVPGTEPSLQAPVAGMTGRTKAKGKRSTRKRAVLGEQ